MSWLGDIKRNFNFKCEDEHVTTILRSSSDFDTSSVNCKTCNKPSHYIGFSNVSYEEGGTPKHVSVESYEQNGRKAVKIGKTCMSKTRYEYLNSGSTESQLTDGFKAHAAKLEQQRVAAEIRQAANQLK